MVIIGIDAHKRSHTLVAVDAVGKVQDTLVIESGTEGHVEALTWARKHFKRTEVTWAVEDSRSVSGGIERALLAADQRVLRVPAGLMKRTRAVARTPGKSDPIDATAVARAVLREPDLPMATVDGISRVFKLLTDRREDLVDQRQATINRLLWRIHELDPDQDPQRRALLWAKHRLSISAWLDTQPGLVAELANAELADISRLCEDIKTLENRIAHRIAEVAPTLLELPGCGPLGAAKIVGETAGVGRFTSEAAFARFAGVVPVPHWTANTGRVRSVKTGNRRMNSALHRIALTQIRCDCEGQAYYRKRREQGDPPLKAIRCLKRRLARVVYQRLRVDELNSTAPHRTAPPSVQ